MKVNVQDLRKGKVIQVKQTGNTIPYSHPKRLALGKRL